MTSVSWSRSGRHLLSGSEDRTVILWSVQDGTQVGAALPAGVPLGLLVGKMLQETGVIRRAFKRSCQW